MSDLDSRLARGPLRVRSVWTAGAPDQVARLLLRRRRIFFALDAAMVCACAAALFFFVGQRALQTHAAQTASVSASQPAAAAGPKSFADGSIAEPSSRETELAVEHDTVDRVVARLKGGARFQVVHNPKRTFEVQAGDVRVRVLGTIFSVQQLASGQAQVLVERGRVEVAWLGGATLLDAGEGGTFPPPAAPPVEPAESESDPVSVLDDTADASVMSPRNPRVGPARRGWRDYAHAGDYDKAYDELHAKGRESVRDDVGDLILAADVARLSGHPDQSVRPLRSVLDRHAKDRRAPVAAFTLGRVLLDDLGRATDAASAFRRARALWPEGPLAEDALARETDAWDRAGRADRVRTLATEYVARYPRGRHIASMQKLADPRAQHPDP